MKRPYCPELDDPFQVFEMRHGGFFGSRTLASMGGMFPTREQAQTFCDRMNAACDLDRRKNDALDWALENNLPSDEVHAAINDREGMGLLAFESRMADSPVVVGGG